jgi:hypothetical protein
MINSAQNIKRYSLTWTVSLAKVWVDPVTVDRKTAIFCLRDVRGVRSVVILNELLENFLYNLYASITGCDIDGKRKPFVRDDELDETFPQIVQTRRTRTRGRSVKWTTTDSIAGGRGRCVRSSTGKHLIDGGKMTGERLLTDRGLICNGESFCR